MKGTLFSLSQVGFNCRIIAISCIVLVPFLSGCSNLDQYIPHQNTKDIIFSVEEKAHDKLFEQKPQANLFIDGFLNNEGMNKYVNRVSRKLVLGREAGYAQPVFVLKALRVQAFTDWGDAIYITRGMLNMINNEDELACLIGHEIGHHIGKSWERKKDDWQGNFLSKVLNVFGVESQWKNEILKQQKDIYEHGWGKEIESEADRIGADLAAKAGYNPYALCDLFERLSKKINTDFLYRIKKLKGTHPALDERAVSLRQFLLTKGYDAGKRYHSAEDYHRMAHTLSQSVDAARLEAIQKEIKENQYLSTERFIVLMQEISNTARRFGIGRQNVVLEDHVHFMEEEIYQDHPVWEQDDTEEIKGRLKDVLILAGQIAVGSIPVVGDAVSFYEIWTGKDFYSGEELSIGQRALGCFSVFIGSGSMWRETAVGIEKEIADNVFKGKVRKAAEDFAKGKGWKSKVVAKDGAILEREGSEVNDQLRKQFPIPEKYQNSYKPGSRVFERIMVEEEEYVRVYTNDKIVREWVVKKSEIEGLTPARMKEVLALKDEPTHWVIVKIPIGTKVREGIAAQNGFGKGGARQTEILSELKKDWYSDPKSIKE